jgi:hypothetical protein
MVGILLYLALGSFAGSSLAADKEERVRIAPASGGVELDEINIVRRTALGAVKTADLTNMEITLWFASVWKKKVRDGHFLVHMKALEPIEDDTGKLLLTELRLKGIECLQGDVRLNAWKTSGGKEGPTLSLKLEAPAHKADKIKAIKGKAEVISAKPVDVTFSDLSAINGKELTHPDLKGLRDMKLIFAIEEKEGMVAAKMAAPFNFASPWNRGRLVDWELVDSKKGIRLFSQSVSTDTKGEGVTEGKTYFGKGYKGWSLRLVILDPIESKSFSFDFKNVELP